MEFEFERHGSSSSGGGIGGGSGGGSSGGSSGGGIGGGSGGGSSGVSESQNCFFEGFDGKIRDCPDDGILYYVIYVRGMEELKRLKMSVSPWSKKRCGKEDRKKKEGHRKLEETKGEYGRERAPLVESRREVGRELRRVKRENRERGRRKKEIDRKVVKNYKEIEGTREILKDVCEKIRDGDVFERQNSKKKLNDQVCFSIIFLILLHLKYLGLLFLLFFEITYILPRLSKRISTLRQQTRFCPKLIICLMFWLTNQSLMWNIKRGKSRRREKSRSSIETSLIFYIFFYILFYL